MKKISSKCVNKSLFPAVAYVMVLLLTACGGGGGGTPSDNPNGDDSTSFSALKLSGVVMPSGAQGAIVTGSTVSSKVATLQGVTTSTDNQITLNPNAMYMVNESGVLEEVDYVDEEGNSLQDIISPHWVLEVNAKWLFMEFWQYPPDGGVIYEFQYLVEKATGRAFYIPPLEPCDEMNGCRNTVQIYDLLSPSQASTKHFKTATNGDIFMLGHSDLGSSIFRIPSSEMTDRTINAIRVNQIDSVEYFEITNDGSAVFYHGRDVDWNSVTRAIRVSDGAITNIGPILAANGLGSHAPPFQPVFIRALDGKVYTVASEEIDVALYWPNYLELYLDSAGTVQANVTPMDAASEANFSWPSLNEGELSRHVIGGKLIYIQSDSSSSSIHEINPTGVLEGKLSSPVSEKTVAAGDYLFSFGLNESTAVEEIYRIDPATYTASQLPVSTEYDLSDMEALTADTVWFKALRLVDAATVIGEVDINGNVTIQDVIEAGEPLVLTFTPIHAANFIVVDGSNWEWSDTYLQITDATADSSGSDATDIVNIHALSDGVNLYFAVSVNGSLDALQEQTDIEANATDTFTPVVQLKLGLTPGYSARLSPSGLFIFDETLYASTATGVGVIGNNVFEGSIPLTSIGSPTSVSLEGAIGWASEDGTLFTSYDTTASTSLTIQ